MSKLLNQGIDAVRSLPNERQDVAGELLLRLAMPDTGRQYNLSAADIAAVREGSRQADRGEFVSEEEMTAFWQHCGI